MALLQPYLLTSGFGIHSLCWILSQDQTEDDLKFSLATFLITSVDHHTQLVSRFCCSPACPRTVFVE